MIYNPFLSSAENQLLHRNRTAIRNMRRGIALAEPERWIVGAETVSQTDTCTEIKLLYATIRHKYCRVSFPVLLD